MFAFAVSYFLYVRRIRWNSFKCGAQRVIPRHLIATSAGNINERMLGLFTESRWIDTLAKSQVAIVARACSGGICSICFRIDRTDVLDSPLPYIQDVKLPPSKITAKDRPP